MVDYQRYMDFLFCDQSAQMIRRDPTRLDPTRPRPNRPDPIPSHSRCHHSRIALLYNRHFGVHGSSFGWKVLGLQASTVVLQATTRLPLLGAVVWIDGDEAAKAFFWIYVGALCFNSLYPSVLLHSKRTIVQRDVVLYCDTMLDLIYLLCFAIGSTFLGFGQLVLPRDPFLFLSGFTPVLHIHTVLIAIERADAERAGRRAEYELDKNSKVTSLEREGIDDGERVTIQRSQKERNERQEEEYANSHTMMVDGIVEPMPRWATLTYSVTTLAVITATVLFQCRDRFPVLDTNPCRPCLCDELDDASGIGGGGRPTIRRELTGCPLVREIAAVQGLELSDMGITRIKT